MKNRRKKKLVDRKVQGRLVVGIASHWLLYFMLLLYAVPMWHVLTVSGFSKPFLTVLVDSWGSMTPMFLSMALLLPVFIWETVKFSNRFVGPVYRLHKTIRSVNEGEPFRPVHFREDDFWHDLADDFNLMMKRRSERQDTEPTTEPVVSQPQDEEELVAVG